MSQESMSLFSPKLAARLDALVLKYPLRRSALVPMLLYAQDEIGYLSDAVIAEVADRIGITELEVRNVATYYSMLRFKPAGKYNVQVCTNISCMLRGGNEIYERFQQELGIGHKGVTADGMFSLEEVECIGACSWAPAIQVNYDFHDNLTQEQVPAILAGYRQNQAKAALPVLVSHPDEVKIVSKRFGQGAANIDRYIEDGGYESAKKCLAQGPDWIIEEMKASNLRGRGGAGFPAGMKWSFVPKQSDKPKYVLVNGDESEPGTCKDHLIFLHDPHAVIEGTIIAGLAIGAKLGFIYLRGEYRYLLEIMEKAMADAYAKGFLGKNIFGSGTEFQIITQTGAGAYEVGEESALMESLEGKRGVPRIKPPFPAVVGLYGGPTVINNAETIATVPHVIEMGGAAFATVGTPRNGGTRLFSISGHVERPGVYELPMGYNLKKMIYEVAGGVRGGRGLKAVIPGGSSTPVLLPDEIDIGMDFDQVGKAGSMLGSAGVVVIDDQTCIVEFALRTISFYQHESCGWCIPCREGTDWLKKSLTRFHAGFGEAKDIDNIQYLAENMMGRTFCPLGDAAAMPILGFVKKFRKEFEEHLNGKPCPFANVGKAGLVEVL
jgi:NADH-quinone oxidoreductase subunit F